MGTYSWQEHVDLFGGLPEPGETYPDDPDALRDQAKEDGPQGTCECPQCQAQPGAKELGDA